ncbi:flagellar biosynthetic protein FliR [Burkholderia cepacia]|uniref:Bacterial export s, 1 family protein n=1 Tax=Burkholderia cepacia TaxID=292 RepID=A0AA88Z0S3_BURCE|nr:flagellar biosynthetic protein FliR [Burkholderia cepacia]KGB98419.1 bacterial export s, 1 family protein [Burkholderia cepacia]
MYVQINIGWTMSALLLSLRIGPVFVLAPPFSQMQVPARVRICLVLAMSACLAKTVTASVYASGGALLNAALSELALGLTIAFAFQAAFAALSFAGRVLDVQAGYGLAMVIDPGSRGQSPMFGTILSFVAGLIFFATGGHLELLRLLAVLTNVMPVGHADLLGAPQDFIRYFSLIMTSGLSAVAAVMITLFLIDLSIAFLSRALPQMNALMLGLQVKTIATLVVMALSAGLLAPVAMRVTRAALDFVPSLG